MIETLARFLNYFTYLRNMFGFWRACAFMFYYMLAQIRGENAGRLHYIPVGSHAFYFPYTPYFAGLFNEIFFKEEYYLDYTDAPIRVFDCGANIGVSLLYIKLRAPNSRVTCFEPNPASRAVLEKNIKANGWQDNTDIVPFALGVRAGKAQFYIGKEEGTDSSASLMQPTDAPEGSFNLHEVTVEPLSRYLTEPVDFLKIDIEGLEFEVLEEAAAAGTLQQVRTIQLEYHHFPSVVSRPLSDMLTFLESQGFETAIQSAIHPHHMAKGWRRNCLVYAWRV